MTGAIPDWHIEICERDIADAERAIAAFDGEALPQVEWFPDSPKLNEELTLSYFANLLLMKEAHYASPREQMLLRDWDAARHKIVPALKRRIADRRSYMDRAQA